MIFVSIDKRIKYKNNLYIFSFPALNNKPQFMILECKKLQESERKKFLHDPRVAGAWPDMASEERRGISYKYFLV